MSFAFQKECRVNKSEGNTMCGVLRAGLDRWSIHSLPPFRKKVPDAFRRQSVFCESPEKPLEIHQLLFRCKEKHCEGLRLTECQGGIRCNSYRKSIINRKFDTNDSIYTPLDHRLFAPDELKLSVAATRIRLT